MSLPIWTPEELRSELRAWRGGPWRLVEAQHVVSTLKLVDSLEEQALLEDMIEETKPVIPLECRHLHILLATPFRYQTHYPHGSRFRRAGRTPGVFYASLAVETAVCEIAFYRLLFYAESPGTTLPDRTAEYTALQTEIQTPYSIDLTVSPLDRDGQLWQQPVDYEPCQQLADKAREAGAEAIMYRSVREKTGGMNIALLTCAGFSKPAPTATQTWHIAIGRQEVHCLCEFPKARLTFERSDFSSDPRIMES